MMDSNKVNLEFYVLNYDFNANKIVNFNIFRNWKFKEAAIRDAERLLDGEIDFAEFKEELRKDLAWQEWGRCEYEIAVGSIFDRKDKQVWEKWDCYEQAKPNMDLIAKMVVREVRRARYDEEICD